MSKNPKDKLTLEKLKQFFRANRGGGAGYRLPEAFVLGGEVEREISPETPLPQRAKVIKDLCEVILNHHVEEESMKKMWHCVKDLLQDNMMREYRHLGFYFLRCLVQGQNERLGMARVHYFQLVKNHKNPEDVGPRLELLTALLEGGRNIEYLEEEVARFMVEWIGEIAMADKEIDFLQMLVNLIKYNAAYIDEDIMHYIVHNISIMAMKCPDTNVVTLCLQVLENIVCYSTLPSQSVEIYICCLCRTVNKEAYCMQSWKIMRNFLGTHMGHCGIYTMVSMLQRESLRSDASLLRGAVFHITFALWSCKRIDKLASKCTYSSVLPAFLSAAKSGHVTVVFEVVQAMHRVVTKYGLQLVDAWWSIIVCVLEAVISQIETTPCDPIIPLITTHLHETLCTIETMIELGQFTGSVRAVFQLIDRCSSIRPESSVMRLINYLSGSVVSAQANWLGKLHSILDRYLHQETRTNIRLRALEVLSNVFQENRLHFEEELIDQVVLPHLERVDEERDMAVRNAEAALVVDVCVGSVADNKHFMELLDILDKILSSAFEMYDSPKTEAEVQDVKTAVEGVIRIFTSAMHHVPSAHAVRAFNMLVSHLEMHYAKPIIFDSVISIRVKILECFMRLRVDGNYRLGYPVSQSGQTGPIRYSHYLLVEHSPPPATPPVPLPVTPAPLTYPAPEVTYLSLSPACLAYITCLRRELDWRVLQPMIQGVAQIVQHKALILSKHNSDIDYLTSTLCAMVSDKTMCAPDLLRNTQGKLTRSDMQGYIFPVLATLASYHARIEFSLQQRLIKCLEYGLASRSVRQCVLALTSCVLEMRDAMVKLLPEVLLNLSHISATVSTSIPILEFLSTLTRLPKLYANFVGDQYMAVFAIALPYTSPFKYNHYTVSLAHHVIAVWFLKCRLSFRKDFVKFMIMGLKANVLLPFEDKQLRRPMNLVNEDSSNRKRSSSLTEQVCTITRSVIH
ncbi:LOW QUALITY PROTEIN: tuberin-like [Homalodisca vitripennis]|uniref:LOW QUALITY PROTEIN: tuberin-like n=1 Tax=Homalodisca vitripennis TaxID=197043 RepID=UPI001EEB0BC4|nr:LOW QUALITY PROTEIN: tuberin-like [Homalodisca vitripennis]